MSRALQSLAGPQPAEPWAHSQRSITLLRAIADGGAYTTDYVAEETGLDRASTAKALWSACRNGRAARGVSDSGRVTYSITEKGLKFVEAAARYGAGGGIDIDAVHRRHDNVIDMGALGGKVVSANDTMTFPTPDADFGTVRGSVRLDGAEGFACTFDRERQQLSVYSDGLCLYLSAEYAQQLEQSLARLRAAGVLPALPEGAAT